VLLVNSHVVTLVCSLSTVTKFDCVICTANLLLCAVVCSLSTVTKFDCVICTANLLLCAVVNASHIPEHDHATVEERLLLA